MNSERLLGLCLEEAVRRLEAQGIRPAVTISRAPRHSEEEGSLRVVRVREDGRDLTVCAFKRAAWEADDG